MSFGSAAVGIASVRTTVLAALFVAGGSFFLGCASGQHRLPEGDPWYRAARTGDVAAFKTLQRTLQPQRSLDYADVNGVTALMVAARNGQVDMVQYLLHAGADPQRVDRDRQSVLLYAVLGPATDDNRARVTQILIENGSDPFQRDAFGAVPIREMVALGYVDALKTAQTFEVMTICDRHTRQKDEESLLELARKNDKKTVVEFLVGLGCK